MSLREYMQDNKTALDEIPYLNLSGQSVSMYRFLGSLPEEYLRVLDVMKYTPEQLRGIYKILDSIDSGGFGHGPVSVKYNHYRLHPRYVNTRDTGVVNLLNIMAKHCDITSESVIIDFLAGSGYLSKKLKQYWSKSLPPKVFGIDVSSSMVHQAGLNEEIVFRSYHGGHLFKDNSADFAISCYGTHHIPFEERDNFVKAAHDVLKPGGKFILHDFEEQSPTARWYSDVIDKYRLCGHPYKHFEQAELTNLFSKYFAEVEVVKVYDPFVLDGEDPTKLKREFFEYLINFFALEKLMSALENEDEWNEAEKAIEGTFTFQDNDMNGLIQNSAEQGTLFSSEDVPIVSRITILPNSDGSHRLIAPRIALAGIGYKDAA